MPSLSCLLRKRCVKFFALVFIFAAVFLFLSLWLPNIALFAGLIFSAKLTVGEKLGFILSSPQLLFTNFTLSKRIFTLLTALLFGINLALVLFFIRRQRQLLKTSGIVGGFGLLSGFLGAGCSACGSAVLSLLGVSSFFTFLPFQGQELDIITILLLTIALILMIKKWQRGAASCSSR